MYNYIYIYIYVMYCIYVYVSCRCVLFLRSVLREKQAAEDTDELSFLTTFSLRQKEGKYLGLLVKEKWARMFVEPPAEQRKTMEIRSRLFKFLEQNDRILLVSAEARKTRKVLAVLEFVQRIKILDKNFQRYRGSHQVSESEYAEYKSTFANSEQDHVFGYEFDLVHEFRPRLNLTSSAGEVWVWLAASDFESSIHKPILRSNTASSLCLSECTPKIRSEPGTPAASAELRKRKPQDVGIEKQPPQKTPKMIDVADHCGGQTAGSDLEGDEADEEEEEEQPRQEDGAAVTCVLLQEHEWNYIYSSEGSEGTAILRPFRVNVEKVAIIVRRESGHFLVGEISLGEPTKIENVRGLKGCKNMYSSDQLESIKKQKNIWKWRLKGLGWHDPPTALRFLDEAPKYKNRPFRLKQEDLQPATLNASVPTQLNFSSTARFFVEQLDSSCRRELADRIGQLASKRACIRIGTTCSGTDVCVSVLKETIRQFNSWKAQLWGGHELRMSRHTH